MIYRYPGATDAETYELENTIVDPDGVLEHFFWERADPTGIHLEIGAGSGFHAVRYAEHCAHVYALEPDENMLVQLHHRLAQSRQAKVSVLSGGAEAIPLRDRSVSSIVARFAYFFGTDACLPGLAEVDRVLAPGGTAFLIDNDVREGLFGEICKDAYPRWASDEAMERADVFYASHGYTRHRLMGCWRAPNRAVLARVLAMEFPHHWEAALARVPGVEISYAFAVTCRTAP